MNAEIDPRKLVLISNSLPKSGSSFLCTYQREIFAKLFPGPTPKDILFSLGAMNKGNFLTLNKNRHVFDAIADPAFDQGPLVIKMHVAVEKEVLTCLNHNPNVFMSFIIRDPYEILMSAMDNHKRTGEFARFETLDDGIDRISGRFRDIYDSVVSWNAAQEDPGRVIPIQRYGDLLQYPSTAILQSLPLALREFLTTCLMRKVINFKEADERAAHRKTSAAKSRSLDIFSEDEQVRIREGLSETRTLFGYGSLRD